MSEDYYDIAWINHGKGIIYGHAADGVDIEQVITNEQRELIWAMNERHEREMKALLKGMVA